ncbi:MAG TPA: homoserine dehydrogenase [Blastocatellia bacterium]|jgi:homoserine dehydrogenase
MELRFAFIGLGNVARAFVRMIEGRRDFLAAEYDLRWRTTAIATARHGSVISGYGVDLLEAVARVERGETLEAMNYSTVVENPMRVVEACDADVLFETSPLDPLAGEPATEYIRRALDRRINVVTANKGPIAFAYHELRRLADARGVALRFEGTVMDGAPVFNLAEYCLPGARVSSFYGVLNSTTNFVLTAMRQGRSFDEALDEARALGICEANSDYDIDGWDAAAKAVALANVLMRADARPADVSPSGIRGITADDLKRASGEGRAIRLISRAEKVGEEIKIRVGPESVPLSSPAGSVSGTSNVLVLKTDLMGELAIYETDPGVEQTAYALLSDLLRVSEGLRGTGRVKL